jgi:hypothetical protein
MADVVAEGRRLGEVFVQVQRPRDGSRQLGDLDGVRQARDEVVLGGSDEHLRLVLQPAEGLGVEDAVAVALIVGADRRRRLGAGPPAAGGGAGRVRAEPLFVAFQPAAYLVQVHMAILRRERASTSSPPFVGTPGTV